MSLPNAHGAHLGKTKQNKEKKEIGMFNPNNWRAEWLSDSADFALQDKDSQTCLVALCALGECLVFQPDMDQRELDGLACTILRDIHAVERAGSAFLDRALFARLKYAQAGSAASICRKAYQEIVNEFIRIRMDVYNAVVGMRKIDPSKLDAQGTVCLALRRMEEDVMQTKYENIVLMSDDAVTRLVEWEQALSDRCLPSHLRPLWGARELECEKDVDQALGENLLEKIIQRKLPLPDPKIEDDFRKGQYPERN